MPESERKIEKLLRAIAKRRRAETGEPFQMHDATRNLLQREISRRAPQNVNEESFWTQIFTRPRLAFAVSVAAIVLLGVVVLIPTLTKTKNSETLAKNLPTGPAQFAKAPPTEDEVRQKIAGRSAEISTATRRLGDAPNTQTVTPPTAALTLAQNEMNLEKDKETKSEAKADLSFLKATPRAEPVPGSSAKPEAAGNFALAKKAAVREQLKADAELAGKKNLDVSQTTSGNSTTLSDKISTVAVAQTDELAREKLAFSGNAAIQTAGGNYRQIKGLAQLDSSKDVAPQNVLASFKVVQAGNEIRIIDNDGSVYHGAFQTIAEAPDWRVASKISAPTGALNAPKQAEQEMVNRSAPPQQQQSQFFKVAGTNRTLNQAVVLNGVFVGDTNELQSNVNKFFAVGKKNEAAPTKVSAQMLNSRISGTAQIGGREVPVEAERVAP